MGMESQPSQVRDNDFMEFLDCHIYGNITERYFHFLKTIGFNEGREFLTNYLGRFER